MQLKKILAIFLAATLIFSILTVSVSAESVNNTFKVGVVAETTPISSSPAIFNSGEDVSVKISVDQNTGIIGVKFRIKFDPNALEYVDYESHKLFEVEGITVEENCLVYAVLLTGDSTEIGDLLTINFRTKSGHCDVTEISTEVYDTEKNCASESAIVPFIGGKYSFKIHTIDATTGIVTEPTCTEEGFTTYHCSDCEEDVEGNIVPAKGHSPAEPEKENIIEPDCTNTGSYDSVVYCSVCDVELSREAMVIDALGHDLMHTEAKEPTCTEIGWDAYDTCQREGCDYTTYVEIPAKGHAPADVVVENSVDSDCTNTGSYDNVVYCSVCDAELSRENVVVDALGHDLKHTEAKEPTCTEIGWDAYDTCQREGCNYTTYVEIPAKGHTPAEAVVENKIESDCTNTGSYDKVVYCSVCDAELSREKITVDASGHELKHVEAKAPTCTEIGWKAYDTCIREDCDYTTYEEIPALGHTKGQAVVENKVEATCTDKGSYDSVVYCTVCNEELSRLSFDIAVLGHNIANVEAKAPTCTEIGWNAYEYCQRVDCGYTTYKEIPALGHKNGSAVVENKVEPTCTDKGSYENVVYCSVCDAEVSRTKFDIAALGHNIVNVEAKAPTCTEIGWNAYEYCQRNDCDYTTYVEIPANGHTESDYLLDETQHWKECTVCKEIVVAKADHSYTNTCDTTCDVCGAVREITHTYVTTTTPATLTEDGKIVDLCSVCGDEQTTVIALPAKIELAETAYTYNGKVKTPDVIVEDSNGVALVLDTDYTITYDEGRKDAGTYNVTVDLIGKYSGSKTLSFEINPIKLSSKFEITLSTKVYTYNSDKVRTPGVTVLNANGTKLKKGVHYTVEYAEGRKNVGKYAVTITMIGNYSGTTTRSFKIKPVKTSISSLSATTKSVKVSVVKKSPQVTGYQIHYSTSKTFDSYKSKYITSYKTTSATISSLKSSTTYYIRVRTYKTVDGVKYYSDWSTVKTQKTK